MKDYERLILTKLIDKYESSKSFIGQNKVTQSFSVQIGKEFEEYTDDSQIEKIRAIDEAVSHLEHTGFVNVKKLKNGLLSHVVLNVDSIDRVYQILKRKPKKDINGEIVHLLNTYAGKNEVLKEYCKKQLLRLSENKRVDHFNGNIRDFEHVLMALANVLSVNVETFQRDFSIRLFGDSKEFERIRGTVVSILNEYGVFPRKETILEELNIVSNPGHVFFKGNGVLHLAGQTIDLHSIDGDIGISSTALKSIACVDVTGKRVVTIENLTTFNAYQPNQELAVYLGGYHNTARRQFIKQLYDQNPKCEYYHYGDIDAGGFYILLHLRERTGVAFKPLHMDVETLKTNLQYAKRLTENDRKRLQNLLDTEFNEVVMFMLEQNCKLEQESMD